MRTPISLFLALCFALSAFSMAPAARAADGAHNSRNSLDWAGTYEGVLPCADCPGIRTRLTLRKDGRYEMSTFYIDRSSEPHVVRGKFKWQPGGNAIALDARRNGERFAVGEGRLARLDPGAAPHWPQGARYVLERVAAGGEASSVKAQLESHRWTLVAATDAKGQRIDTLASDSKRPIAFEFANGRIAIEGGCNRGGGGYRIDAEGRLVVGRFASTMMACDPAAMKIDEQLAALLAEPMRIDLAPGTPASLRLDSAAGGTLVMSGTLTPEARFGAPERVFLEVAAQRVACDKPPAGASDCLSVREIAFDNKGLRIGTPGAWHALQTTIDGYTHQPGIRNVLRIKRFHDKASGATHDVLDMVVESETVAR